MVAPEMDSSAGRDVRVVLQSAGGEDSKYALKARTEVTVPDGCGRKALRTLVSKLLQLSPDEDAVTVPEFHFAAMLNGERIPLRTTLGKFFARHSVGDIALPLEYYIPLPEPKRESHAPPQPAWIHALDAGKWGLVSGSGSGTASVRDVKGGVIRDIEAHAAPIKAIRWINGGEAFITAGQDEAVRVWSTEGVCTAQLRAEDMGACTSFEALAVSESGGLGACGGFDGSVWLLPLPQAPADGGKADGNGKRARPDICTIEARRLGTATGLCTSAAAFDAEGMLQTASWDGTVRVWDTKTANCTATVPAGGRAVTALCAGTSVTVVTAIDGAVRMLDARGERGVVAACKRKGAHRGVVNDIAWVNTDTSVVSAGCDGTLRVWDLRSIDVPVHVVSHAQEQERGGDEPTNVLAVTVTGDTLASGGSDGRVTTFGVK